MIFDRRVFLSGLAAAIAAPYVVRSGILMPVKKILQRNVVSWIEGSYDGKTWYPISRVGGRGTGYNPVLVDDLNAMLRANGSPTYKHTRVAMVSEWKPPETSCFAREIARVRYPTMFA